MIKKIAEQRFCTIFTRKNTSTARRILKVDMKPINLYEIHQPINLPWKIQLELVNRNMNTVFSICKRQEIGFIAILNEGMEQLEVKFQKHQDYFLKNYFTIKDNLLF